MVALCSYAKQPIYVYVPGGYWLVGWLAGWEAQKAPPRFRGPLWLQIAPILKVLSMLQGARPNPEEFTGPGTPKTRNIHAY